MSDASESPKQTPSETIGRLDAARQSASWLAWGGLGLAFLWWVAAFVGTIALVGTETLGETQPAVVVAGIIAILLPGLMLVLAGMMAREQARATAANALVLESAARLLLPAETMAKEARVFAQEMSSATEEVDRSMGHALSAMKAMSMEIGDERQRLESVTYASADNARDLAERLSTERTGLEQLARDLREQTDLLNEAIPEQADMMVASAKAAASEVAAAEDALQGRLETLDRTGRSLAQKISALDTLAAEAGDRNETLLFAIARMEEKLETSRKTVETAVRAGELAAAAAGTTGDRLLESVKIALDGAREASNAIHKHTYDASESTARALSDLKEAGEQAAAAIRAAGMAARSEMDISERRATNTSLALLNKNKALRSRLDPPLPGEVSASPKPDRPPAPEPEPIAPMPLRRIDPSPSNAVEEDLFEASADRMAEALMEDPKPADDDPVPFPSNGLVTQNGSSNGNGSAHDGVFSSDDEHTLTKGRHDADGAERSNESLSSIIADMERDERSPLSREETAEALLNQLQESGIRLTDIIRPKDKKKIAVAARKGEDQRRTAINQQVGRQVERVRQRLRGNLEMMTLARDFLALEESDALNALENTHASNKNASARLATYLLLDAAVT
ncbi:MAG: hypothetical protein AAGH49_05935 [Pseudomonadota bacterium]